MTVVNAAATAGVSAAATTGVCLEPEHDENANDPALPQRGRHLVPTRACPGPDGGRPGATPWRPPGAAGVAQPAGWAANGTVPRPGGVYKCTDKVLLRPPTAQAHETRALFGTQVPSVAQ